MTDVSSALRKALGFSTEGSGHVMVSQPYVEYVEASWVGRGERQDFLRFFIEVVSHFRTTCTHAFPPQHSNIESLSTRPRNDSPPRIGRYRFQKARLTQEPEANSESQTVSAGSSIQEYLSALITQQDHYYFNDTTADSSARESAVNDTVFLILGTWLLSQSYFIPGHQDQRRIVYAYCCSTDQEYSEANAFDQSIATLISKSGLLPNAGENISASIDNGSSFPAAGDAEISEAFPLHHSSDMLESLSIDSRRLNATNLSTYSHVEISWTANLSRHMLLSKRAESYYLEIFALPCALQGGGDRVLSRFGISTDLIDEIECSYAALFNPSPESKMHKTLARIVGLHKWCWCLYCTAHRFRKKSLETLKKTRHRRQGSSHDISYKIKYDDRVRVLMEKNASQWDQTDFRDFWPRIIVLDSHLQRARPWNFWVLFRDKRDTVQYWTFLFGTVILISTVAQVILSIAQVVSSY